MKKLNELTPYVCHAVHSCQFLGVTTGLNHIQIRYIYFISGEAKEIRHPCARQPPEAEHMRLIRASED